MNKTLRRYVFPDDHVLEIVHGDLLDEQSEAIVNAANASLQHGDGVAGAIAARGGPDIQRESNLWVQQHGCVTHDKPAITSAGRLPFMAIIHAVGPIWGEGDEDDKLSRAITGCLEAANQQGLSSLSMPPISTGIFGFPKDRAALIFFDAIQKFNSSGRNTSLSQTRIVIIDISGADIFAKAFDHWQGAK
jgi:putative ATPase